MFDMIDNPMDVANPDDYDIEDLHERARQIMKLAKTDLIELPDFVLSVQHNNFEDDDYLTRSVSTSSIDDSEARTIRRKYGDYFDWADAIDIYDEYIAKITDMYGPLDFVESLVDGGVLDIYIPPEPKLKMKKKNKKLLNSPIPVWRDDDRFFNKMKGFVMKRYAETHPVDPAVLDLPDEVFDMDYVPEEMEYEYRRQERKKRKKNIYLKYSGMADTDAIIDFINSNKPIRFDQKGHETEDPNSIIAIYEEMHKYDGMTESEIARLEAMDTVQVMNGRLVRQSDIDKIEVATYMYKCGLDIGDQMKDLGKSGAKMLRQKIGAECGVTPMTKKERKKLKKRQKKAKKRAKEEFESDSRIMNVLNGHRRSFFRNGEMSFRLSDIDIDDYEIGEYDYGMSADSDLDLGY